MSVNPNPGFALESWVLYGIGAASVVIRLISRTKRQGLTGLQSDDYLVVFGLLCYTLLCVAFNQILNGAGSNLMSAEDIAALTPETRAQRVLGSKWVFVSEHAMLLTIWSMKAAMLVLYARITDGLMQRKILNGVIVWVVLSFIGDELALFTICRPIQQYWQVPVDNVQCSTYEYYQIVNAIFNISTDIMLLAVGLPPILRARLTIQQKLILGIVLGMGSFVVVAAILRAIYCLVPSLISYVYMNWYFREASVAIYVTNAPAIWILMRDMFPGLHRLGKSSHKTASGARHYGYQQNKNSHGAAYITSQMSRDPTMSKGSWVKMEGAQFDDRDGVDLEDVPIKQKAATTTVLPLHARDLSHDLQRNASRDTDQDRPSMASGSSSGQGANVIRQDVTFTVESVPKS